MELIIKHNNVRKIVTVADKPLARGGEGAVHLFVGHPELEKYCVKVYHPKCRTADREQKLAYMIKYKPKYAEDSGYLLCWPQSLVYEKTNTEQFVGFVMPIAYPDSVQLYDICHLRMNRKYEGTPWEDRFDRSQPRGNTNRARVCIKLAQALYPIHSTGKYVLVDFKPQNVLLTNTGLISLTDLDSIQIAGENNLFYPAKVATPEYAPKEARTYQLDKQLIPETWDRFSVAVVFYEILLGIHPYTATANEAVVKATTIDESISSDLFVYGTRRSALAEIPQPHKSFNKLPTTVQNLFQRAFGANPLQRPSTNDWGSVLYTAATQGLFGYPVDIPPKPQKKDPPIQKIDSQPKPKPGGVTVTTNPNPQPLQTEPENWKMVVGLLVVIAILYWLGVIR